ncbi:NupC/NupG family nucleoside CNT transporter [Rickettsiales bacterium LUAb2]
MGAIGVILIIAVSFLMSNNKKNINYRTISFSFLLLIIFAIFVLTVPVGITIIQALANAVLVIFEQGKVGVSFLFGSLASQDKFGFIFAITVLGNIIFFGALTYLLYYLKIMQLIINCLSYVLSKLLKTSRPETVSSVATIFLGPGETQLFIKPFLNTLTHSELFTVMVSGLTAIAGSVMVGYIALGMSAKYIISATFMSIPSSIFISKLMFPEVAKPIDSLKDLNSTKSTKGELESQGSIIEAITNGGIMGLKMAAVIGAMLISFLSLIALINVILTNIGDLFHIHQLTLEKILGILLYPVAYVMGIPKADLFTAGSLIGTKTIANEFVAFLQMSKVMSTLSDKSKIILTFTLCGFANISTLGIIIGSIQTIAPSRIKEISQLAVKALIAATLANILNGCIAGIIYDLTKTLN